MATSVTYWVNIFMYIFIYLKIENNDQLERFLRRKHKLKKTKSTSPQKTNLSQFSNEASQQNLKINIKY